MGSVLNFADPNKVSGKSWYRFSQAASDDEDSTDLYIHDEIGGWGVYSTDLIRELLQITTSNINVRINSPGGDVFEGLAIHNALMTHPSTISTYTDGLAASAASFIFQAGAKGKRKMGKYAQMMVHNPSAGVWGEATDLRKMADLLDKLRDTVAKMYADRSGQEIQQFIDMMAAETWFNAEETVEFGLADSVDDTQDEKPKNSWDLGAVYMFGGRDHAPAPTRRPRPTNRAVPPAPVELEVEAVDPVPAAGEESALSLPADFADLFKAAVSFAATPPVPTDQAPFEFDPEIFRAIMADATKTAPAVAVPAKEPDPVTFEQAYDPDVLRNMIIERM